MDKTSGHRITQTASHWGVYDVETDKHGKVVRTTPFHADPNPPPFLSSLPDTVHSALRISQPHVRAGFLKSNRTYKRGGEPFVPVSWDEALDLIAGEFQRIKAKYGNEAIYGGSYGWASAGRLHHAPSVLKRFLGLFGRLYRQARQPQLRRGDAHHTLCHWQLGHYRDGRVMA